MKNLSFSTFSYFLGAFNLVLIFSTFFANSPYKAVLWIADLFLVSVYFILLFFDKESEGEYYRLIAYLITVVSSFKVIDAVFGIVEARDIFFSTSILQGIASGIGAWILLYFFMEKFRGRYRWEFLALALVNIGGLIVSQSKAALIGFVVFLILLSILRNRKFMLVAVGLLILVLVVPLPINPVKKAFTYSLTKDPYAAERINIWKMSLGIFSRHLLTGVGPGNFPVVSGRYNFKQEKGPANYFKVPALPHNDYLRFLTETGIAGLLFLFFLAWVLIRKMVSSSRLNLSMLLVLYLLFQAFLFDVVFDLFFFFLFIFFLKNLFEERLTHQSFSLNLKAAYSFLLVVFFLAAYLLPYLSYGLVKKAGKSDQIVTRYNLLIKAAYLNPIDHNVFYLKSESLFLFFEKTSNLESFYSALADLKKAQRLNPYFIHAYLLESDLYRQFARKGLGYETIYEEIVAPLAAAEQYAPLDPFIKLRKAEIYLQFDRRAQAKEEALRALKLEPDFVAALYFLHHNFRYFVDDAAFKERIDTIMEKVSRLETKIQSNPYLSNLYSKPAGAAGAADDGEFQPLKNNGP
jgi:tetratricopeptide (TPR) repeat protein